MSEIDIQKAIEGFKMDNVLLGMNEEGTKERNNLAIQALQEKLERDKGCEYCTGDVDNREELLSTDDGCVYIDGNNNLTYQDHSGFTIDNEINVCPMCGRKLVE